MPALDYGPILGELLGQGRLNVLGAGQPVDDCRSTLESLKVDDRLAGYRIADPAMAMACMAGLWLRFDFLDESHRISQDLDSGTGSFWHGIMHRREGDFSNSKYWFRQVGRHPVYEPLAATVAKHLERCVQNSSAVPDACRFLGGQRTWDPFRFVDLCEAAVRKESELEICCKVAQECEWNELFIYCWRRAVRAD